jgi:hypothetical protein
MGNWFPFEGNSLPFLGNSLPSKGSELPKKSYGIFCRPSHFTFQVAGMPGLAGLPS